MLPQFEAAAALMPHTLPATLDLAAARLPHCRALRASLSLRCERSRGRRTRERVVGGAHAS
jgi:hypothetical protein